MIEAFISGFLGVFVLIARLGVQLIQWLAKLIWSVIRYALRKESGTFGTARWAKTKDLKKLLGGRGLIIGKWGRGFLRYNDDEGLAIVFAPTGSGKGVGLVLPNLLDYQGSVICTDPKGENYAVTRRHREKYGDVFCINLENPEESSCYNPMDSIRKGTVHEKGDAHNLALLMLVPDKNSDSHWRDKAAIWLTGFILHVLYKYADTPELCTLTTVRDITNLPPKSFQVLLEEMSKQPKAGIYEVANAIIGKGEDDKERSSILSTMEKATRPFSNDDALARIAHSSDFSFNDLNANTKSIYIVAPEEGAERNLSYVRLIVGIAMNSIIREKKERGKAEIPPLLMLDELANFGYLDSLERNVAIIRAYARAFFIFQDIKQLRAIYPKAESIISNTGCQIFFGVNDIDTAEYIAKRVGHTTIHSKSEGLSQAHDAIVSHQQSAGKSEASRYLIDPSEIIRLPNDESIMFLRKLCRFPIKTKKVKHYKERYFKGKYDEWG
jgi:type IV secretion system protein VirD4